MAASSMPRSAAASTPDATLCRAVRCTSAMLGEAWMQETMDSQLPPHIEQTVGAIAALHAEHREREGTVQRIVRRSVDFIGRPRFVALLTAMILSWVGVNGALGAYHRAFDAPP